MDFIRFRDSDTLSRSGLILEARHEYTRTQNGNIIKHKQLDSNIDSSSRSFIRDSFDANQKSGNIESIDIFHRD